MKKNQEQKPNTMVLDAVKGRSIEYIKDPPGLQWRYGNQPLYLVRRDGEVLNAVEPPNDVGETPEKLHRALFWDREASILFVLKNPFLEIVKTFGIYILAGVMLLAIYLLATSK